MWMCNILGHLVSRIPLVLSFQFINDWATSVCIFLHIPELENNLFFSMALSLHAFASVQEQVVINHEPSALSQLSHFSDFLVIYLSIHNNKLQQPCTWPQHLGYTSIVSVCYTGPFSVPRLVRVDALQNWTGILLTTLTSMRQLSFLFLF